MNSKTTMAELITEENEFSQGNYEGMLPIAKAKLTVNPSLTGPQRVRVQTLITAAETLHAAGQSAAAADILMIAADFADGYYLTKPLVTP